MSDRERHEEIGRLVEALVPRHGVFRIDALAYFDTQFRVTSGIRPVESAPTLLEALRKAAGEEE